jgi:aldehyde dehydrogenase (NAD(P)+)
LAPPGVDPGHAVAELRYGTVGVNHWSALGYAWMSPPWGGYPGGDSGTGFVHNTYLLTAPRQTVLRGPFRPLPRPVWFATHRHGSASLSALCRSYTGRGLWQLPAALWHGLRG